MMNVLDSGAVLVCYLKGIVNLKGWNWMPEATADKS